MGDTLGRRIQESRRAAGLSQEALGERLGVSRQAVSKWEADAAVPELENLIAMSRLLGVPIGALLGVERAAEDAPQTAQPEKGDPAPDTGLTEQELDAVEAIAAKYMEAAERRRPRWSRKRWAVTALGTALVLLIAGGVLWGKVSAMDRQLQEMGQRMDGMQSSVSGQISRLSGDITDILNEKANILSNSNILVTGFDLEAETVTLMVSAQPKEWTAETSAVFVARQPDGTERTTAAVNNRNGTFTVEDWEVPMGEEILVSVVLNDGESNRAGTLDTLWDCLPDSFRLVVSGSWDASWGSTSGHVTLKGLALRISPSSWSNADYGPTAPAAVELCLYRNQETEPEQVIPVPEALELWRETGFVDMSAFTDYTAGYDLVPGDTMAAVVRITDWHGQTTWTVLNAFGADRDGLVKELDSKGNWNDYIWKPGYTIR